jgi:PAS domain S-box-containing protein
MERDINISDTVSALAYCRRTVLQRASTLLTPTSADGQAVDELTDAQPGVAALLMTSLEELKVAEEELREQADQLANRQSVIDDAVRHYRQIFQRAPLPVILTDRYGSIHDANVAAEQLLRREARYLYRKPLAALAATPSRDKFRVQLAMMTEDRPREWRLELRRNGDVPVEVWATVGFVPEAGPNRSGLLCWMIHPRTADER